MKVVARVNLEGLYVEDEIVEDEFSGVSPIAHHPILSANLIFDESSLEEEGEGSNVMGYLVGISVPPGLYKPRFDLERWKHHKESNLQNPTGYWSEGLTLEEIKVLTKSPESDPTELDRIGFSLVQRELEALELRQQNEALGAQIVEKEIQMMTMQAQNQALGASLVGFELRLMSLESDKNTQPEGVDKNV
ncbi:hypothetical protein [Saccharibacillus brassicae]|uniref:Uncharacterized protein n=1 Tax=Saccharibacillus brassicae TaxID=2583377 RepID=A0A4Y6UT62_SACBS|nr:hypothetical protein [Saccharibacillus brassicae]QDH19551.1 hypothetical protein FFV09_00975 [Saccharibacillus brassicae]